MGKRMMKMSTLATLFALSCMQASCGEFMEEVGIPVALATLTSGTTALSIQAGFNPSRSVSAGIGFIPGILVILSNGSSWHTTERLVFFITSYSGTFALLTKIMPGVFRRTNDQK